MSDDLDLPMPDLDPPPGMPSWRVRASAFRDPVTDAEKIADLLSLPLADAQRLAMGGVFQLSPGASWKEADGVAELLRGLGAKVSVEDANALAPGTRAPSPLSSMPPSHARASSAPPSELASSSPPRSQPPSPVEADRAERSFWAEVGWSFLAPVLGRGSWLILGCGAMGGGAVVLYHLPLIHLKLIGALGLGLAGVGLLTEIFARLAQAASSREPGESPSPHFDPPDMTSLFLRGLFTAIVLALLVGGLAALGGAGLPLIGVGALALLAWAFWPMGLAVQCIAGRLTGIFDVFAVVRGVAAAPLEYAAVVAASFVVLGAMSLALGGATLAMVASDGATSILVAVLLPFLYFCLLGYLHGVLGYLMGALVAAKSEGFEFLIES